MVAFCFSREMTSVQRLFKWDFTHVRKIIVEACLHKFQALVAMAPRIFLLYYYLCKTHQRWREIVLFLPLLPLHYYRHPSLLPYCFPDHYDSSPLVIPLPFPTCLFLQGQDSHFLLRRHPSIWCIKGNCIPISHFQWHWKELYLFLHHVTNTVVPKKDNIFLTFCVPFVTIILASQEGQFLSHICRSTFLLGWTGLLDLSDPIPWNLVYKLNTFSPYSLQPW
jgi:hypothetical protein